MLHRTSRRSLLSKNLTFQAMSTGWVYPLPVVDLPYYIIHFLLLITLLHNPSEHAELELLFLPKCCI